MGVWLGDGYGGGRSGLGEADKGGMGWGDGQAGGEGCILSEGGG